MKTSKCFKMSSKLMLGLALLFSCTLSLQAQEYGFMYLANKSATATTTSGQWHTVGSTTDNEFIEGTTSTDWSYSTNQLIAKHLMPEATYLVKFSLSFGADIATWQIGISKNGGTPSTILYRTISSATRDAGVVYGVGYISLDDDDTIELMVRQDSNVGREFDPHHAQVVLVEMTDNSTNYYGGMKIEGNTTLSQDCNSNTWTQLTGFDLNEEHNDWTVSSNELVAGSSAEGTYLVTFSASYLGRGPEGNPDVFDVGIALGTDTNPTKIITKRKTAAGDVGNICGVGLLFISADQVLRLEALSGKTASPITLSYCSISLFRLSGTTEAPRAYMEIKAVSDQTISTLNSYSTVTGFSTPTNLNDWSFSTNTLNATSGTPSAGSYIVDYAVSFQKATGTDTDVAIAAFSIFLGSTEQTELTIRRKLSDDKDVGAAGGTGLINIASASTLVSLRLKNESSSDDLTINACTVDLHRVVTGTHDGSLPVELSKWSASSGKGDVRLEWTTESEIENQGFIIERKLSDASEFRQIASYMSDETLSGQGSTTKQTEYAFIDRDVSVGESYDYRLCDVDYKGKIAQHDIISVVVSQEENTQQPVSLSLMHAYPNPFNPATTIEYGLSQASPVKLTIYDVGGNEIARLVEGPQEAGWHTAVWNGLNNQGQAIPTGVYLVHLQDQTHSKVIKISYLK